jgi:divinyl protochlorophyllide a 8-vinyl-reductase
VTRLAQALAAGPGAVVCDAVFARAGLARHLRAPPTDMVADGDVAQLQRALHAVLGHADAARIAREAGRLTGDYLLAHRIPHAAQWLLRRLPRRLAARVLVAAIARHAWTFTGSGAFSYAFGRRAKGLQLQVIDSPVARLLHSDVPTCDYYVGTFARVFSALLGDRVRVVETQCAAQGAFACRFAVTW